MRTARALAGQEGPSLPTVALALVLVALALGLLGGAVPAVAHQVAAGRLPDALEPEQYLGAPTAFSVSGLYALLGSAIWATTACAALFLYRASPKSALVLLGVLDLLSICVNVALPLSQSSTASWSVLGLLQAATTTAALLVLLRHSAWGAETRAADRL
jgi:hypothetical protein